MYVGTQKKHTPLKDTLATLYFSFSCSVLISYEDCKAFGPLEDYFS